MSLVTRKAPDFTIDAVVGDGDFKKVSLGDYKGKYVVLFFYPADFTFICPTEIQEFSRRYEEFRAAQLRGAGRLDGLQALAQGVDQDGLGKLNHPLLADFNKTISSDYEALIEGGIACRATIIIDPTASFSTRHTTRTCSGARSARRCVSCRRCRPASAARSNGSPDRRRWASRRRADRSEPLGVAQRFFPRRAGATILARRERSSASRAGAGRRRWPPATATRAARQPAAVDAVRRPGALRGRRSRPTPLRPTPACPAACSGQAARRRTAPHAVRAADDHRGLRRPYLTTEVWSHFDEVWLQPMYIPVIGWEDGRPRRSRPWGRAGSSASGPGSGFYSPFWQIVYFDVPETAKDALRRRARCWTGISAALRTGPDGVAGAGGHRRAAGGTSCRQQANGWVDGQAAPFLDFGKATFTWNADA